MKTVNYRDRIIGLEYHDAQSLEPHPGNWRNHGKAQVDALRGVLSDVGIAGAILAYRSERNGGKLTVIDGHLRRDAAPQKWPVLVLDVDDAEADYILATHDPLAAMADADAAALDALLSSVNSGEAAVQEMLAALAEDAGLYKTDNKAVGDVEPQVDRAEELRQKWGVEPGQLWELGAHRLICGDCTDGAVVARLMGGEKANTLIFDPEWDAMPAAIIGYDSVLAFCDGATVGKVVDRYGSPTWLFAWDCISSWYTPNRPLRRSKHCCWYGNIEKYNFDGWHYGDSGEQRTVWNTRGEYTFIPDPRGKHLSDVFSHPITQLHAKSEHNHSKPIDWICLLIANCTAGDVFDPFSGSGTTLLACEALGRRCRAVEIAPGYVAVALERWATATGKTPTLEQITTPAARSEV
jgi:hypothetical protein